MPLVSLDAIIAVRGIGRKIHGLSLAADDGDVAAQCLPNRIGQIGGQLGCRLIRIGQRRRQAHPVRQLRRHFLVRPQTPRGPRRTHPFTRLRIAPVIHADGHLADHGVQRQWAGLPLAQGGKARQPPGLALATVAAIAGASRPAPRPTLALRFPSVTTLMTLFVSWLLPRLLVVLGRRGTASPQ